MRRTAVLVALLGARASSPDVFQTFSVRARQCGMVDLDESLTQPKHEMPAEEVPFTVGGNVLCIDGQGPGCIISSIGVTACTDKCLATPDCDASFTWRACDTELPNCVLSNLRSPTDYLPPELRAPLTELLIDLKQTGLSRGCNITRHVHIRGCNHIPDSRPDGPPNEPPPPRTDSPAPAEGRGQAPLPQWVFDLTAGAALLLVLLVGLASWRLRRDIAPARPKREVILLPLVAGNLSGLGSLAEAVPPKPVPQPQVVDTPDSPASAAAASAGAARMGGAAHRVLTIRTRAFRTLQEEAHATPTQPDAATDGVVSSPLSPWDDSRASERVPAPRVRDTLDQRPAVKEWEDLRARERVPTTRVSDAPGQCSAVSSPLNPTGNDRLDRSRVLASEAPATRPW